MTALPPPDPPAELPDRADRHRTLTWLRAATWAAFALALLGLLPGSAGQAVGSVMVIVLVAAPLVRVVGLGWQWRRPPDRRFAAAAAALMAVIALGAIAALLQ